MLFNVYYLNFSKVYEIKMMLSNVIKTDKTIETNQGDTVDAELQAKMGTKFLKLFKNVRLFLQALMVLLKANSLGSTMFLFPLKTKWNCEP